MSSSDTTADRLVELGFSRYEARAYLGLLGGEPLTGYALANETGIPQPKVYETLRRLESRGAVVKIGTDPARFAPLAPAQLLRQLETEFRERMTGAQWELERFAPGHTGEEIVAFRSSRERATVMARAGTLLSSATDHVYLSGSNDELAGVAAEVIAAADRGIRFDVLHFGDAPFDLPGGRMVRHASTDGVVFRHHQAHHVALVVDSQAALWAVAPGGRDWQARWADDPVFAAVVKGYIRHDIYVQQIFNDLPDALTQAYGPGLSGLLSTPATAPPTARRRSKSA